MRQQDGVTRSSAARKSRRRRTPSRSVASVGGFAGQAHRTQARVRQATKGPTSRVQGVGTQAGRKHAKQPRKPTRVFAQPPTRDFDRKGTPRSVARQRRQAKERTQRAASRSQAPLLPKFPLLPSYTPQQRAAIRNARINAAKTAVRQGVPPTRVQRYLVDTHDNRVLEPYRRAERQTRGELNARFGAKRGPAKPGLKKARGIKGAPLAAVEGFNTRLAGQLQATGPGARVLNAPSQIAQAFAEKPWDTFKNTGVGAAQLVAGIPAGVVAAITHPGEVPKQVRDDYIRRYGPLLSGNNAEFRKRIQEEGAAAELVDAATIVAPSGSVIGRGTTKLAKQLPKGSAAREFLAGERPRLRVSGGKAVEQELSPNAFVATAQRARDRNRVRRLEKRNEKAAGGASSQNPARQRGLQPEKPEVVLEQAARQYANARQGLSRARKAGDLDGVEIAEVRAARAKKTFEQTQRRVAQGKPTEVVSSRVRKQAKLQRQAAAGKQSRFFQAFKNEQGQEIGGGASRSIRKLSKRQREAVVYALEGTVPVGKGPDAARRALRAHKTMILKERGKRGLTDRTPELDRIDYLLEHADEVFGKRGLQEFRARELERSKRVTAGDERVKSSTAEVRRRRPQGELLGVRHEYDVELGRLEKARDTALRKAPDANARERIKTRHTEAVAVLDQLKPLLDEQFIRRVDTRAAAAGLPEPAYVKHYTNTRGLPGMGDYALGGSKAMAGVKQSKLEMFRAGERDTRPLAYEQSLAEGIKGKYNWRLVAEQVEAHKLPDPTPARIEKALGYRSRVDELSGHEWKKLLRSEGVPLEDVGLWNPGRREGALLATGDAELLKSKGWVALPRAAYDELTASGNPSGVVGRSLDKFQGIQSAVLLGTSPGWLQAQVAANAFVTGFAIKGRLGDLAKAHFWYRSLPDDLKAEVDAVFGTGAGQAHGRKVHLGATANNRLVNGWRVIKATAAFRKVERFNPVSALFAVDNAQNRYFRKVVLYNSVKKQAFKDLTQAGDRTAATTQKVAGVLNLGPTDRMRRILRDPELFDKHARNVNDFLGDYVNFTANERRTLKRFVLFYGFFRYALRTLFYTVPLHHPVMGAITAKLAQLHVEEVKELMGGDDTPWAYSRLYFGNGDDLHSIDLARINPVGNPLVESLQQGPKSIATAGLSPMVVSLLNQAYGKDLFLQRGFRVGGQAAYNERPSAGQSLRVFADDVLSLAAPYRVLKDATQTGTQGDDSLLLSPRPLKYKTSEARKRENVRRSREPDLWGEVVEGLVPFAPKADFTRQQAESRRSSTSGRGSGAVGSGGSTVNDFQSWQQERGSSTVDDFQKWQAGR